MDGEVAVSKVSVRGQTAIPKAVRRYMKLNDGDFIVWKIENGKIMVEKRREENEVIPQFVLNSEECLRKEEKA